MSLEERIRTSEDEGIRRVGTLLNNLGLVPRLVDEHLRDDHGRQVANVDLVFEYENHFFVIEVSLQSEERNEKILAWFQRFNPGTVELVRRSAGIQANRTPFKIYFDLTRESDGEGAGTLPPEVRDAELSNSVLFKDDIEYFEDAFNKVRVFARYDLLSFLGVHPEESSVPIRGATQFYMGEIYALSFVVSAEVLLRSAYVFRRRGRGIGYQRFLNFQRIREIEGKVRDGRILSFPNSILINIERELTVEPRRGREQCPASCRFEFPIEYCSSRIIDGQHRLMGIARLPEETRREIYLQVIAFSQLNQALEIRTFVEINNNQRRVDSNLVLNLIADFTWPEGTIESFQRSAVLLARQLQNYRLVPIYFGAADEAREGKIYLTTFVSSLLSNNLIGGRYYLWRGREFENMSEILRMARNPQGGFTQEWRRFLSSNKGFRILVKLVYLLERNRMARRTSVTTQAFLTLWASEADESMLNEITSLYGGGGVRRAAEIIVERLRSRHADQLSNFVEDLRALRGVG